MRGHLQCRDTLAGNAGCPLKTGTTVYQFMSFVKTQDITLSQLIFFCNNACTLFVLSCLVLDGRLAKTEIRMISWAKGENCRSSGEMKTC